MSNLQFIYATDLHGNCKKYRNVLKFAIDNKINLIHLGADILPKNYDDFIVSQKYFLRYFLFNFYEECEMHNIKVLASFGNDDVYVLKKYFMKFDCLLDENPYVVDSFKFIAYNYVPDYPFGLKTACKLDSIGCSLQEDYLSSPIDIMSDESIIEINNIGEYFRLAGTIEGDLSKLKCCDNDIVAFHCPPAYVDLDVCSNGRRVGSHSIYEWIKREQPKLVLCGHIHESYDVTNKWKANIGKTLVIQPGQCKKNKNSFM